MKRSEINLAITQAIDFFAKHQFPLPPFSNWTREVWLERATEASEIRDGQLGWDVTDFHSGKFASFGLTLFTLRNGGYGSHGLGKSYGEKIMHVREGQVTPLHCHHKKTEDIINRGGPADGNLVVQLYDSAEGDELSDLPVVVFCDGLARRTEAGGTILLRSGESVTLPPRLCHSFYAVDGDALIGEVSSINDDSTDNHFHPPLLRYPAIIEDEPPLRLLCIEYPSSSI